MGAQPNPYAPPPFAPQPMETDNTSGMGAGHPMPPDVPGWSTGAFLLNWIWAIGNGTFIGLLCLVPYVGFIMAIVLGVKGREWAWQNKRWASVEEFNRVQRLWSAWGIGLMGFALVVIVVWLMAND